MLRTYAKRKKGSAEEKFDMLFDTKSASDSLGSKTTIKESKRRKITIFENSSTSQNHGIGVESSSLKFDSLYEKVRSGCKSEDTILRNIDERVDTNDTSQPSKYDILFEKNEKLASDKFDAIFAESEYISKPKHQSLPKNKWSNTDQSKILDDLSLFNSWKDDSDPVTFQSAPDPIKSKLPGITHASMVKLGGRLVLNIQRGGENNALLEKGGTVLMSPEKNHIIAGEKTCYKDPSKDISNIEKTRLRYAEKSSSRKLLLSSNRKTCKANVSYNCRPWAGTDMPLDLNLESTTVSTLQKQGNTKSTQSLITEVPTFLRSSTWPRSTDDKTVTAVKCQRGQPKYFTVIRHVKNYQNCLEDGEIQEFKDEVQYLQEGLAPTQPLATRCLSLTSLASKCELQNFRLYLRAHNVLSEVFGALGDADQNNALGYATSCLLYMLSRDRKIDITKVMLVVLLKLADPLGKNAASANADRQQNEKFSPSKKCTSLQRKTTTPASKADEELESVSSKVKELIDRCGDPLVTSENLSTKVLASEALLRYTARRTSEWYREEIRLKGGLDHIINLVKCRIDDIERILDLHNRAYEKLLCTVERLLRVLENSIMHSSRNAMYLVTHQRALLLKKISLLMTKCCKWMVETVDKVSGKGIKSTESKAISLLKNVVAQTLKLLINISNDNEWASTRIGDQDGIMHSTLFCVLCLPKSLNEELSYEIMLLGLGLLINLVESSASNRMVIMKMKISSDIFPNCGIIEASVVKSLVQLFVDREIAARENEILGEDGVKKAAKEKLRREPSLEGYGMVSDEEGYWVESDGGMEWVHVAANKYDDENDVPGSQSSVHSVTDPIKIEAKLTAEERKEMKEALEKANDHMEASIIASYTSLVLGCLIHGNQLNTNIIRSNLPNNGNFKPMITMLKKFLSFMSLTHGMSKKGEEKLSQVIEELEEINLTVFQTSDFIS